MPPILFGTLQAPFTQLAYKIFPTPIANGIISGSFAFCKWLRNFDFSVWPTACRRSLRLYALCVSTHLIPCSLFFNSSIDCIIPYFRLTCVRWRGIILLTITKTSSLALESPVRLSWYHRPCMVANDDCQAKYGIMSLILLYQFDLDKSSPLTAPFPYLWCIIYTPHILLMGRTIILALSFLSGCVHTALGSVFYISLAWVIRKVVQTFTVRNKIPTTTIYIAVLLVLSRGHALEIDFSHS